MQLKPKSIGLISLISLVVFGSGLFLGYHLSNTANTPKNKLYKIHPKNQSYQFINPLLGIDWDVNKDFSEYESLKKNIEKIIQNKVETNLVNNISYYFRNLDNGKWIGINENEAFDPASLLKVPVMIAYLKKAESNPKLLSTKILFTEPPALTPQAKNNLNNSKIKPGQEYTVEELIKEMIINSDNIAKDILLNLVKKNYLGLNNDSLQEVYTDLGINIDFNNNVLSISPRTYSLFFRVLYNGTYLNYDLSEKAMTWLTQTTLTEGLATSLPNNITLAHKFGEYRSDDGKLIKLELHDCGIVYYPGNPYLICVMTKGTNPTNLIQTVKDLGQATFSFISNQK